MPPRRRVIPAGRVAPAAAVPDPEVERLTAEVRALRAEVERLRAGGGPDGPVVATGFLTGLNSTRDAFDVTSMRDGGVPRYVVSAPAYDAMFRLTSVSNDIFHYRAVAILGVARR